MNDDVPSLRGQRSQLLKERERLLHDKVKLEALVKVEEREQKRIHAEETGNEFWLYDDAARLLGQQEQSSPRKNRTKNSSPGDPPRDSGAHHQHHQRAASSAHDEDSAEQSRLRQVGKKIQKRANTPLFYGEKVNSALVDNTDSDFSQCTQ